MIDIDKVIILENEEEYLVLDKVNYENIEYYYIAKLNESRTDIENNYKLVTIIESSGNKVISEVTGTSSLKKILPLFENHLYKKQDQSCFFFIKVLYTGNSCFFKSSSSSKSKEILEVFFLLLLIYSSICLSTLILSS